MLAKKTKKKKKKQQQQQKQIVLNPTNTFTNISKRQRLWSTETPNLNSILISILHFKIPQKTKLYHADLCMIYMLC